MSPTEPEKELSDEDVRRLSESYRVTREDREVVAACDALLEARARVRELERTLALPVCRWCQRAHCDRYAPARGAPLPGSRTVICRRCYGSTWGDDGAPPVLPYDQLEKVESEAAK